MPQQNGVRISLGLNSLKDLLEYDEQNGFVTRWDFLEDAMRRFEEGSNVYTLSEDGILVFCAWHNTQSLDRPHNLPIASDAVFIDGIYCHWKVIDRIKVLLHNVAREIRPEYNILHCAIDKKYKGPLFNSTLKI